MRDRPFKDDRPLELGLKSGEDLPLELDLKCLEEGSSFLLASMSLGAPDLRLPADFEDFLRLDDVTWNLSSGRSSFTSSGSA